MSQRELAEKAGCNANTIAKMERGEQEPAWPLVLRLAAALGVDCTAFSGDDVLGESAKKPAKGKKK